MKIRYGLLSVLFTLVLISCSNEPSLQEYYVNHKENKDFVMVDVPTSLISPASNKLTEEQRKVINTVDKINMLAYPLKNGTKKQYDEETAKVKTILDGDVYEELMNFGKPGQRIRLYFKGEEEAIDEVVVYALDDNKGFMLARVLGDDMNVSDMIKLVETMKEEGGIDTSQFEGVMDVFENK